MRILTANRSVYAWLSTLTLALALTACAPELPGDPWLVQAPTVLAVSAGPAEVKPGQVASLRALIADPQQGTANAELSWFSCSARPKVAEAAPVAAACLGGDPEWVQPVGLGQTASWTVPVEACAVFGPSPPPAKDGQPAGRPADPDATGGFYAPLRLNAPQLGQDPILFRLRLRCALGGATQAQSVQYNQQYRINTQPDLQSLAVQGPAPSVVLSGPAPWKVQVKRGSALQLRTNWKDCPDTSPCGGAETYLRFDPATRILGPQREAIRISWYATGGDLRHASTGRSPADTSNFSTNDWTAPALAGSHWLWLVVRDDRGGVSWAQVAVEVN